MTAPATGPEPTPPQDASFAAPPSHRLGDAPPSPSGGPAGPDPSAVPVPPVAPPVMGAGPLPRLHLPGVSDPVAAPGEDAGKKHRRTARDPGVAAKDRRGGASRDQRKFVPRRGGG